MSMFAVLTISALASSETPSGYSYNEPAVINYIQNNEIPSAPSLIPAYNYQITSTDFVSEPQVLNLAPQPNIEFTPQIDTSLLFQYNPAPNPLPEYNPLSSSISAQLPQQIPSFVSYQETIIEHQPIVPVPQFFQGEQYASNVGSNIFAETVIENQPLFQIPQTAPALQYAPSIPSIQNIVESHPIVEFPKSASPPSFVNSVSPLSLPSFIPPINFVTGPGNGDNFVGDVHTGGVLDHQIVNQIENFVLQEEIRSQKSYEGSASKISYSLPTGQKKIIGVSLETPTRSLPVIEYTLNSKGLAPQQKHCAHQQSQQPFLQTAPQIHVQELIPQQQIKLQEPQIQYQQPIQQQQSFQQVQQLETIPHQIISPEPRIQFAQHVPQIQYQQAIPQQQTFQQVPQIETIHQHIISLEPQIQYQQPAPQQQIVQQVQPIEKIPQQIINPEPQIQFAQQAPIQYQQSVQQQQIPQQIPQIQHQIQPEETIALRFNDEQFTQQAPQENVLQHTSSGQGSVFQSVNEEPQINVLQPAPQQSIEQRIPILQDIPEQNFNLQPEIQQHKVDLVKETLTPTPQNTQFVAKPLPQPKPQIQLQPRIKPNSQKNQNSGVGSSFKQKLMQMLKQKLQQFLPQPQQQQESKPRPAPQQDQRPNIRPKQDPRPIQIPIPQTQPKPQIIETQVNKVQQIPQLSVVSDVKSGQQNQIVPTTENNRFEPYGSPRK